MRPRWTPQTAVVVAQLMAKDRQWGRLLAEATGLKTGTVHPILMRLEEEGMAVSEWEADAPQGRPRRRYYTMTADGRLWAAEQLMARPPPVVDGSYPWVIP
jgi:PadR family transcriptional regulator PadR